MAGYGCLYFSTFLALCGITLVAIGFGTNNWREYKVDRDAIDQTYVNKLKDGRTLSRAEFEHNPIYFTRYFGFFHVCFDKDTPKDVPSITKSPLGFLCTDIVYNETISSDKNDSENQLIHMKRLYLSLYVVGLFFCLFALLTLLCGCSRSSYVAIVLTGLQLLLACGFIAAAIGTYHKFLYLDEYEKIDSFSHYPPAVKNNLTISLGWSYIVAWVGVGVILISAISMFVSSGLMSCEEEKEEDVKELAYSQALMTMPPAAYSNAAYDKTIYASPQAPNAGYNPYSMGYGGYNTYNPYGTYYYGGAAQQQQAQQQYYPYYTMR